MTTRECPYCGKMVSAHLTQCTYCREPLTEVRHPNLPAIRRGGRDHIRRGLLFMLAAAVVGYFASGSSALKLPVSLPPIVVNYLSPLLFLSGLGLSLHGLYLRYRSSH